MSNLIKGPWKPRNYDPRKDPEFKLERDHEGWELRLLFVVLALALSIWLFS